VIERHCLKLDSNEFEIDNVPYPSQKGYNEGKIKKRPYEFPG
jgi:hypothetical protein